jgi:beta-hydroxylase
MVLDVSYLPAPRYLVLAVFIATGLYVHHRGRVKHKLFRQLTDHSTVMAPYNTLMYLFSAVPAEPYVDVRRFPELAALKENWEMIRDEGLKLFDEGYIRAAAKYNDVGFNSFFRTGWKRFYLKWYDDFLPSARALCPRTTALLAGIPSVNAAMFTLLPPGSRLVTHRDPFAGSLRYHLGLKTPNSDQCRIVVDGIPYAWNDGEDVVFDETYIHYAENQTDQQRLILLCDVERPLSNPLMRGFNRAVGWRLIRAAATQNVEGEHIGLLNRIFAYVYQVRLVGKRIKARSRPAYYAIKWLLLGAVFYAIFF